MSTDGYGAVVYDLDGTVVELAVDWDRARRDAANALRRRPVDATESMDLWELLDAAEAAGVTQAIETTLADHEREGAWNSRRLPIADELPLAVPVGVCSLNCEAACTTALERHGLANHVDVVVGRDSHSSRKPDPGPLLATLDALDVPPDRGLFVGDSRRDQTAADRAGVDF